LARADLALRRTQTQALLDLARIGHAADARIGRALRAEGLADITSAQANALLVLVNAREPGGWVERAPDPSDSRAWLLSPTAKTRTELPKFIRVTNGLLDRAFGDLEPGEIERVARCLARIRDRLDG
jgi:DNA-binding MarR family transcriptional regulator